MVDNASIPFLPVLYPAQTTDAAPSLRVVLTWCRMTSSVDAKDATPAIALCFSSTLIVLIPSQTRTGVVRSAPTGQMPNTGEKLIPPGIAGRVVHNHAQSCQQSRSAYLPLPQLVSVRVQLDRQELIP